MSYRVVFVGAGRRGQQWIQQTLEHGLFEPVAIVDPADTARERVAADFPDLELKAFRNVAEAAGEVEADVAIDSAVSWLRKENCLTALSAGWHVLVEKPFALSVADARAIVEAGKEAGKVVSVGQNYRFRQEVGTMQRMVARGELGKLGHGVFVRHTKRYGTNTYQQNMRHSYLWEMGVHDLDIIRFTLGLKPLRVAGVSFLPPWGDYTGETTVSALYEFEAGVRVNYFGAWASHIPELHWRIDGSGGSLRYANGLWHGKPEEREWRAVEQMEDFGGGAALLNELAEAIQTGGETSTSGQDDLWTVAMMEAVVRSTDAGGEPVSIVDLVEGA